MCLTAIFVLVIGYMWGGIITVNRSTYREPGELPFIISELTGTH